jgi:RNase P subunit RPR2
MSISDAYVVVTCDKCGEHLTLNLTAIARGGWDERYVQAELKRDGWECDGERHICPEHKGETAENEYLEP